MKTFKYGNMTVTINTNAIITHAVNGLKDSMNKLANDTKNSATSSYPGTYDDRGGLLSSILEDTGLADKLNPGELSRTWRDNASRMIAKTYKDKIEIPILDIGLFNRNTEWWGLSSDPKITSQKIRLVNYSPDTRLREYRLRGKIGSIINSDNALRPLPSSTDTGFIFMRNPYPGYGYWKLYNDGFVGYNVAYAPRPFIAHAFSFLFGNTSHYLTSSVRKVKLDWQFKEKLTSIICTNINKKMGTHTA